MASIRLVQDRDSNQNLRAQGEPNPEYQVMDASGGIPAPLTFQALKDKEAMP